MTTEEKKKNTTRNKWSNALGAVRRGFLVARDLLRHVALVQRVDALVAKSDEELSGKKNATKYSER